MANKQARWVFQAQNGDLVKEEGLPVPEPGQDEVLIEVKACGVCHSDTLTKYAAMPGISYPRCPGHEVAGVVVKPGPGARAAAWSHGDRVGAGWFGRCCFTCDPCRRGNFILCKKMQVTGYHYDGGYQKYQVVAAEALAKIPDSLSDVEAAPLLCAGITVFNAIRLNLPKRSGGICAVQGIGGLGHLALQYANKMGFTVVAVSRGPDKKEQALALGAHIYIDSKAEDPVAKLTEMGGADLILSTAFSSKAMSSIIDALSPDGTFLVVGADPEPLQVNGLQLLTVRSGVRGHPSGSSIDSEDAMAFAARHGVRAETVVFPFSKASEAFDAMMAGKYRVVIDMTA